MYVKIIIPVILRFLFLGLPYLLLDMLLHNGTHDFYDLNLWKRKFENANYFVCKCFNHRCISSDVLNDISGIKQIYIWYKLPVKILWTYERLKLLWLKESIALLDNDPESIGFIV